MVSTKMLCTRLARSAEQLRNSNKLWRRHVAPQMLVISKKDRSSWSAKAKGTDADDFDKPIRYSTSDAAKWRAENFRKSEQLWYQGLVVSSCLATIVIYLMFIREENDLDEWVDEFLFKNAHPAGDHIYGQSSNVAALESKGH